MQPPQKLPPLANLIAGVTAAECVALADACCERREFDRAVEAYRHALTLIPLPLQRRRHTIKRLAQANGLYAADVHVGVGNALLGRSQVAQIDGEGDAFVLSLQQQAVLEYAEAVEINPKHVQAQYNLGTLLYCLGDAMRAEEHLANAATIAPHFVQSRVNLAVMYAEQGEGEAAKAELKAAINVDPRHRRAHLNLALLLLSGLLIDEDPATTCKSALEHLRTVVELEPRNAEGHHCLGAALLHAALRNDIASTRTGVGVKAVARRELLTEAMVHYRAAAALQESSDCARPTPYASVLATEGLSAGFSSGRSVSLQTWQRDSHSGARRASVQVGLGGVYGAVGQCKRSEACYKEALRICPDYPDALFGLATVTEGKIRLRHLKALLRVAPKHTQGKLMMGQCRRLVILGADALAPPEKFQKFNPYIQVWWNEEYIGSTTTKQQTIEPRYGEPFVLPVEPRGRSSHLLRIEVHNRLTKALLGGLTLRVGGDVEPGVAEIVGGQVEAPPADKTGGEGGEGEGAVDDGAEVMTLPGERPQAPEEPIAEDEEEEEVVEDTEEEAELRAELEAMKPSVLRDRARATVKKEDGSVDEAAIAEAEDTDDPKQSMIALVMAAEKAPPPVIVQRKVCLVGARGLKNLDRLGKADPYAVLSWNYTEIGQSKVVKRTLKPEWGDILSFPVKLTAENHLRVEVFDHNRRGPPTFMGQLELSGPGLVGLAIPSNGAVKEFELVESTLPYRDNQHVQPWTNRAVVMLASPDTDTANLTQIVDSRLPAIHALDQHKGRHADTGTHFDAMQRSTCPPLAPVPVTSYPLSWPLGYAAKRPVRGSVRLRIEPEPVILCAYAVLKRVVCREEFDATSATMATLEPGQLVLASEVREASHGGARVKCTQGWLNERTPSGQKSLELLDEDDERYLAYIRSEAEDERGDRTHTYKVKVVTSDVQWAGTDSNVFVCMFGIEGDSGSKKLVSKKRFVDLFERGSVDEFEVVADTDLGPLQTVRVSTDGKGMGAGWHCGSVTVIQPDGATVYFPCDQWFDEHQGDGQIERELVPDRSGEPPPEPPPMSAWSVEEVVTFISDEVGMPKVAVAFAANDIDGQQLCAIDDELLTQLGMARLQRFKFWKVFEKFVSERSGEAEAADGDGELETLVAPSMTHEELVEEQRKQATAHDAGTDAQAGVAMLMDASLPGSTQAGQPAEDVRAAWRRQFNELDTGGDGNISVAEFAAHFGSIGWSAEQIAQATRSLDSDHDGKVSFDEFCDAKSNSPPPADAEEPSAAGSNAPAGSGAAAVGDDDSAPMLPPEVLEGLTAMFVDKHGRDPTPAEVAEWAAMVDNADTGSEDASEEGASKPSIEQAETSVAVDSTRSRSLFGCWSVLCGGRARRSQVYAAPEPDMDVKEDKLLMDPEADSQAERGSTAMVTIEDEVTTIPAALEAQQGEGDQAYAASGEAAISSSDATAAGADSDEVTALAADPPHGLCTTLYYEDEHGTGHWVPLGEIGGLVEAGTLADDTLVFSDQPAFPFESWTAWSQCWQCFIPDAAAAAAAAGEKGLGGGSDEAAGPEEQDVDKKDTKKARKESRKERKAREKKEAAEKKLASEEAEAQAGSHVPQVDSFGVGPAPDAEQQEDEEEAADPNSPAALKGLVRDIQLRWDGTIHFQTCTPETIVQLKERRAAAVRRKEEEEAAAIKQAERIKTREESRRLERLFSEMDDDASGALDAEEVTELATQLGWAEPELVFGKMDIDGDGTIDVSEFRRWWLGNSKEAKAVREQKKQEDVKISEATMRLKELPVMAGGNGLKGLTAGQLAVLT